MWKEIKHEGVAKIEKLVAEYNIWELNIIPCGKFKVKIYENTNNNLYTGYTNILVADELGSFYCAVGYGETEELALEDTITEFFKMVSRKAEWEEQDFQYADPYDF